MGSDVSTSCTRCKDGKGPEIDADFRDITLIYEDLPVLDEVQKQVVARPRVKSARLSCHALQDEDRADVVDLFTDLSPGVGMYKITLDRSFDQAAEIGLEVDMTGASTLPVTQVTSGLAEQWNAGNPDSPVVAGDVIIEINGVRDDSVSMLKRLNGDHVLKVVLRRTAMSSTPRNPYKYEYLIVGGGVCAGYLCRELVKNDVASGEVAIMAAEDVPPYERPALTKAFLHHPGAKVRARLPGFHCCVGSGGERQEAEWYAKHGIAFLEGPAAKVDFQKHIVTSENGAEVAYTKLILATGCRANSLSVPGIDLEGIHHIREERDCSQLVADLERLHGQNSPKVEGTMCSPRSSTPKAKVLVVGGGYIGMEVAAGLMGWNFEVTIVYPDKYALHRFLNSAMAEWMESQFSERGAKIIKGSTAIIESFVGEQGAVQYVQLKSGVKIPCDVVVIGVGATPNIEFCKGALNTAMGGIQVDSMMETSELGVYAVGDICAFPSKYGGLTRCEHVDHARKTAVQAARAAMELMAAPYDYLPYFYSRIFEYTETPIVLIFYGDHSGKCFSLVRKKKSSVVAMWVKGGKVMGALLMSIPGPTPEEQKKLRALAESQPKAADIASTFKAAGL